MANAQQSAPYDTARSGTSLNLESVLKDPAAALFSLKKAEGEAECRLTQVREAISFVEGLPDIAQAWREFEKLLGAERQSFREPPAHVPHARTSNGARTADGTSSGPSATAGPSVTHTRPPTRKATVREWLLTHAEKPWTVRQVGESLGLANLRSLRTLMDDLVEDCQATKVVIGPRSVAYQAFSDERRAAM